MGLKWNINNDAIYAPFHFATGALVGAWWQLIINMPLAALFLTISVGAIWEIYEWSLWKFVLKKPKYKPKAWDTRNDMILDLLGGMIGIGLATFYLQ